MIIHPFDPIYTNKSEILILGTMLSLIFCKKNFYYSHPKNRFWKVLSFIFF